MSRVLTISGTLCVVLAAAARPALGAAVFPPSFAGAPVATGLASPTAMQFAPDGRLFVCEQGGALRIVKDGTLLPAPFVTITVNASGERGLLGVAFDPSFSANHWVYVYYTATTPAVHNRISRFTANGDVAAPASEMVIFDLDNLSGATNHNGGALAFGPDQKLYAAVGENGNTVNAQSMSTVLGKVLRLNKDGTIPADNPFYLSATGKNRAIWALGLRNPFTFAFNPAGTDLFINDVGESTWEEIDDGIAGANYGWPDTEGATTNPNFKSPRYAYNHTNGACAITGGAFYAPLTTLFPASYVGDYFFADYCGNWIRKLDPSTGNTVTDFATGLQAPVDLKVGADGGLYYLERGYGATTGIVYRIFYNATSPVVTTHPASQTVAPGAAVTFSVRASGTPPMSYQWQRNGADIPGATSPDYVIASVTQADNAAMFRALARNNLGSVFSNTGTLTVTGNQPPTPTITLPATGTTYTGGSVVAYAGTATDPEDISLPASAFTWQVDFHHDTHMHPFMPPTTGATFGSFTIPTAGETSANVWYRIYLTVRDTGGLTGTTQFDILPQKASLTLATNPAGLLVKLDGQPVATPVSFDSVVGIVRTIEATSPQPSGSTTYDFTSWSDTGAVAHAISTPPVNTLYTATYSARAGSVQRGISINFVGSATAMAAAESAGVVAKANWNNATGATRSTPLTLIDETGAATGATVTWSSNSVWRTPVTDQAGNRRMMKGYLDTSTSSVTTVTVAGLTLGAYDVYLYVDGDNASFARTGAYAIGGAGVVPASINLTDASATNFNATFTQANNSNGNYVKFSINVTGTSALTLTATPGTASSGTRRAPLNGVQIVPTAPPPPDFTIAVTPDARVVTPGGVASYAVAIGAVGGFDGPVSFNVTGLPANATPEFTPTSVTGSGSATLNVTTAQNTPPGSSPLNVTATSGALNRSAATGLMVSPTPSGAVVSIDFVGSGTAIGAAESAGVVSKPNWNNATGAARSTPLALVNELGAASGATVTWTSASVWSTPITNQAGDRRVMKGYLDTSTTSVTTATVAGLPAGTYDVYVYADGDNGGATRGGTYGISGAGITPKTITLTDPGNTNFNATFTQANNSNGNYVKFTVTATGFTLTATPGTASDGVKRAPVNGIQIVPVTPSP